ncbi:MAG: hypothetical protein JETT_2440 [Candidatus Jettenia ecosi]|uniref:Uncharacterized protein n=1 Tax=Candidatus Jettenia ecosi TaxID=2494326 RepID=A0A533Q9C7_9BACT|nr:MAG: hypothetical protein JETT_2440 [Candidatus Jettenia ecosi]
MEDIPDISKNYEFHCTAYLLIGCPAKFSINVFLLHAGRFE